MDWMEQIRAYRPLIQQEVTDQKQMLEDLQQYGSRILFRDLETVHMTCSGFVLDASMEWVLMVQHKIYQSVCWTGGHADGCEDLLAVAVREAQEETGLSDIFPLCSQLISLEILPVPAHEKYGKPVAAHRHNNVTYGLIGSRRGKPTGNEAENDGAAWYPVADLPQICKEAHMLPIYEKLITRMRQIKKQQQAILKQLPSLLLPWYAVHARDLPWRKDQDPYHVWVSEIMLQQTRVEAVKTYYLRFLKELPNLQALAESSVDQVQKLWEGLGYYTRVKNLRLAAKMIQADYGGVFPDQYAAIRKLPGIGDYTAGAICSICFQQPTPAVDGNVLRVIMRLTDCYYEIDSPTVKRAIQAALAEDYPTTQCGDFTQSLIEIGATVCLPNGVPQCDCCPLAQICRSHLFGTPDVLPTRKKKQKRKVESRSVFILQCGKKYALRRREQTGLLAGMWEYPNVLGWMSEQQAIHQATAWDCQPVELLKMVHKKHIFTHIEWNMIGFYLQCRTQSPAFEWYTAEEIRRNLSLPTAFRMFRPDMNLEAYLL